MDDAALALARVVQHLVDHPEAVRVRALGRGRVRVLEVEVDPSDMGAVIGRGGRTAQALRTLLRTRGDVFGTSYDLRIREPGRPIGQEAGPATP
jgi:predicted RNA-binding protein YlqC (UPF0109 family)